MCISVHECLSLCVSVWVSVCICMWVSVRVCVCLCVCLFGEASGLRPCVRGEGLCSQRIASPPRSLPPSRCPVGWTDPVRTGMVGVGQQGPRTPAPLSDTGPTLI